MKQQKVLFVHTPKAAGVHTSLYIRDELKYDRFMSDKKSSNGIWVDYNLEDINGFLNKAQGFLHTHTLAYGWHPLAPKLIPFFSKQEIISTITTFREKGWFVFSFIKHPGQLLCSFYHYVLDLYNKGQQEIVETHCPVVSRTIDQFVNEHCDKELLPEYWKVFDFIGEANDEVFKYFYKKYFDHNFQPKISPSHASSNKGYFAYCEDGTISEETQKKIEQSENMEIYKKILYKNNTLY